MMTRSVSTYPDVLFSSLNRVTYKRTECLWVLHFTSYGQNLHGGFQQK